MTITFDTLAYAKKLKEAGVPERQAEVQAEALADIVDERLATKQDIRSLQHDIELVKQNVESLRLETKRDIKEMEVTLKRDIKEMELRLKYDLTVRLGGMITASVAVMAVLIKIL